jgi:cbb3-type cytochrome oxidase subunit 3
MSLGATAPFKAPNYSILPLNDDAVTKRGEPTV